MTPDEYRTAIAELGLSQVKAGRFVGADPRTSRRWATEGTPPSVGMLFAALVFIKNLGLDPFNLPTLNAARESALQAKKSPPAS